MANGTVDVNLFVNAFSKGLNDGARIGTPFSNFTNSLIAGFDAERKAEAERQQIEINQNKIDMMPVENTIREAEAVKASAQAEVINQDKQGYIDRVTKEQELDLQNKQLDIQKKEQEVQFQQILTGPPEVQEQAYTSGQLDGYLNANPEKKKAIEQLSTNWSETGQKYVLEKRVQERVSSMMTQAKAEAEANYGTYYKNYIDDNKLATAVSSLKTDPLTFLEKAEVRVEQLPAPRMYVDPVTKQTAFGVPPKEQWIPGGETFKEVPVLYFEGTPRYDLSLDKDSSTKFNNVQTAYRYIHDQFPTAAEADAKLKAAQEEANKKKAEQQAAAKVQLDEVEQKKSTESFRSDALATRRQPEAPKTMPGAPTTSQSAETSNVPLRANIPAEMEQTHPYPSASKSVPPVRPEIAAAKAAAITKAEEIKAKNGIKPKNVSFEQPTQSQPTQSQPATVNRINYVPKSPNARISPEVVERVAARPELKDMPAIVKAVVAVESGGKTAATSRTGVKGLMQVTKGTMQEMLPGGDVSNPTDSVLAGSLYLAKLMNNKVLGSNPKVTLAAYNGGPGLLRRAVEVAGTSDWNEVKLVLRDVMNEKQFSDYFKKNKINLDQKYKEIVDYPEKVLSYYSAFSGNSAPAPVDRTIVNSLEKEEEETSGVLSPDFVQSRDQLAEA